MSTDQIAEFYSVVLVVQEQNEDGRSSPVRFFF